jgi:hypothetical protein
MITSMSGLAGYYEGSMRAFLNYLVEANKTKNDPQIENVIIGMRETLAEGKEIEEEIKKRK